MIVLTVNDQHQPRFARLATSPTFSTLHLPIFTHDATSLPAPPRMGGVLPHPDRYDVLSPMHAPTSKYRIVPHPPLYISILDSRIPLLLLLLSHAQAHARITPLLYSHTIAINLDYLFLLFSLSFLLLRSFPFSSIPYVFFCQWFAFPFKHSVTFMR